MRILLLFLRKELKAIGSDRRVWPVYVVFPVLAIGLPTFLATLSPLLIRQGMAAHDPGILQISPLGHQMPGFADIGPQEGITPVLLRGVAAPALLMLLAR